jgi:Ice-binding-like
MTLRMFTLRRGARRFCSRASAAIGLCTIAILAALTVAGSSQAVTPPTVLLGTAGQFAVLAGSGITNVGASTISGDVGSSPTSTETGLAACPGANCVTLTGANHTDPDPNDATTQGAKSALTTAYNDAAGRSPATVLTELGGQTLVAGVYSSASGTFGMTGTLVLDGENNADAVFIFQTASTLITGGAGNITLIRGAQACNIFWKVGSAATLGAGSTFRGTIFAHDDISLGDGVTVDGRLLAGEQASGSGAVTLIHDTITSPTACVSQASIDTAAAQAQAAANAAAVAQAAADKAVAAAKAADVAAATAAAAEAAAASAKAQAAAAKAAGVKTAAAKAAKAVRVAKAAAARAARARALAQTLAAVRTARVPAGFTG